MNNQLKLRTEELSDRILKLEQQLNIITFKHINEQEDEVSKLQLLLNQLKELQNTINLQNQDVIIDNSIKDFKENGLLLLNIDNVRLRQDKEEINNEMKDIREQMKKLQEQNIMLKSNITELIQSNNELLQINTLQEQHINNLKGKAFGADLNPMVDQNKKSNSLLLNDQRILEGQNMNNNLWDKNNIDINKELKIDDYAKDKQLWIGNASQSLDSVRKSQEEPKTNMRQYSKMLISNKN
jgi:hypothetical protein